MADVVSVVLDLDCLDRMYLNGSVPKLQGGGQVRSFAEINGIPVLHLNTPDRTRWDDRKVDHVREYVDKATEPGVVAIVVGQQIQKVFMGHRLGCRMRLASGPRRRVRSLTSRTPSFSPIGVKQ